MITRRTFVLGLSALLVGCGGGGGGSSPNLSDPTLPPPVVDPPPDPEYPVFGSLTTEFGYYVLRDANGTIRVKVHIDSLPGSHVVEPNKVTVHHENGSTTVLGVF